ncbi:MAG: hypothetical protein A3F70_00060 [Acidobacteria bacterium RIFCSPLOWO2_12_FULL_67_14]|nr:MAG: hypothetical protein A3F70_00060 [Acidobacteria bacterium RIFCSPLOWO2_12_FULL_67_14]
MFMMVSHDRYNRVWKLDGREKVRSDRGVALHLVKFGWREFPWLVEDVLWYGQFSHVMQESGCCDRFDLRVVSNTKTLCKFECVHLHTSDVTMSDLVFRIDSHRQCFDGRKVQLVHLRYVPSGVLEPSPGCSKSEVKNYE